MIRASFLPLACLLLVLPAAAQDQENAEALAGRVRSVFKRHCLRCHDGQGSQGGDFDILNTDDLAKSGIVATGKPDESYLFERVRKDQMPPRNISERPTAADGDAIRRWIQAGAPKFPVAVGRKFISLASVLTAIRDHLRQADRDARPFLRYFTLHNLYNNPQVLDEDLRLYRAALSKAINSVSRKPRIVLPQAVDSAETIFAIDITDLDWDRGQQDLWRELLRLYPYGVKFANLPSKDLRDLDAELSELTGCELPFIRADWFVANAMRPPLYHTLLQLPQHAGDLEKELGVDIPANFVTPKPERIARGGFPKSGVSGQNRLVERHDAQHGYYWKSYDFLPGKGRSKLSRFPLGPLNLFPPNRHPYPFQAFVHDGGELIWALPNGLQGYMLVNGQDERIDDGPINVVDDPLKTSGTPAIVNGLSCMACHKQGMIPFKDTIRDGSAVFGAAEQAVRRLYPEHAEMDKLVDNDRARFMAALRRAIGPFLLKGPDAGKDLEEFAEPIGQVARFHRLGYLDLRTIACDLEIEDPQSILTSVGAKKLKQLGLDVLLKEGGVISRLEWEAIDGVSLMQELARELRYTPYRPL